MTENHRPIALVSTRGEGSSPAVLAQESRKASLRSQVQERVHHFTFLKRDEIARRFFEEHGHEIDPDELDRRQPLMEEYDPVVELALIASDYSNEVSERAKANAQAAQYLRPKLSAVAIMDDPAKIALENEKAQMAGKLAAALDLLARAKAVQQTPAQPPAPQIPAGKDDSSSS